MGGCWLERRMDMSKIVTICGSMKFQRQMMALALKLELEEKYLVIQCVYPHEGMHIAAQDIQTISRLHYKKIDMSDAVYVVNVGGYIGEATQREIDYARAMNKEVLFLEPADG